MDKAQANVTGRLFVFFEDPFWVGIFEKEIKGKLSVCKVTFGPEPKDYDVAEFILKNYDKLQFSPAIENAKAMKEHVNPKRLQREVKKQLENVSIGTKSQQALKLQQEQNKLERKAKSKEQREEEKQFKFEMKQQKKKEKHRGR